MASSKPLACPAERSAERMSRRPLALSICPGAGERLKVKPSMPLASAIRFALQAEFVCFFPGDSYKRPPRHPSKRSGPAKRPRI